MEGGREGGGKGRKDRQEEGGREGMRERMQEGGKEREDAGGRVGANYKVG